jgi:prefoldin beta subunit
VVTAQLQQVQQQVSEAKSSLEELEGMEEGATVYKSAGALMVQVKDVEALKGELKERMEELEVREKSYSKHESSLRKNVEELRDELNQALSQGPQAGQMG